MQQMLLSKDAVHSHSGEAVFFWSVKGDYT
jgi:hypothetical protein